MSLRLFPNLTTRFAPQMPLRAVVRQFSAAATRVEKEAASGTFASARLGTQQFFTSSTPKMQFLSGAFGPSTVSRSMVAARGAAGQGPAWSPASSFTAAFFRRAFSTSRPGLARPQYYGRGGGSWQQPPKQGPFERLRQRLNGIRPDRLVWGIIGINVAIFLMWQYAINSYKRFRDPTMYNWMYKNLINSMYNLKEGRVWTLITSSFSHMSMGHIFMNCLGMYFIGMPVASVLGGAGFLTLYLGSGLVSSIVSLLGQSRHPNSKVSGSDGASGAIYGTLAFFGGLFPTQQFLFFFVVPMPAWLLIGGIFTWDLYSTISNPGGSMTDSAGHVGGMLAGLAAAVMFRRGVWRPRPW